jgi:hypothetical protein
MNSFHLPLVKVNSVIDDLPYRKAVQLISLLDSTKNPN